MSTLVLRVDGSEQIGYGHAVRCLALAQAWRDQGGSVSIVCACLPPPIRREFLKETVQIIDLPEVDSITALMLEAIESAEWVIFDSYDLPPAIRDLARVRSTQVGMIDDFSSSSRPVNVDLLVDPNLGALDTTYADDRIGSLALGPKFALLRRHFRTAGTLRKTVKIGSLNILISLGGTRSPQIAKALIPLAQNLEELGHQVTMVGREFGSTQMNFDSFPKLLPDFDLAISGAGSTIWELLCSGVPVVAIPIAQNQLPIALHLSKIETVETVLPAMAKFERDIEERVIALVNDPDRRAQRISAGRELVDGMGAQRIVKTMRGLAAERVD